MAKFYVICHVILCYDMTMSWHEVHFWSFNLSLHEKSHKWLITLVCWYLVSYEYMWPCTSRNIGQISYILCQLLVCSGKSQLSNYVNAHCLQISIWTWLMSYHVKTTLCHDITTYDISWQPYFWAVTVRLCPTESFSTICSVWEIQSAHNFSVKFS